MDFKEISSLINKVASSIEENEKFSLPIIAAKARREAQANQKDTHLINASSVLTKMASSKDFITKKELREVVNTLGASNSKLAITFEEEIGRYESSKPVVFKRAENENISIEHDYNMFSDSVLSNALSNIFEEGAVSKVYSKEASERAERAVYAQLLAIGVEPKGIETFAGKEDIIICKAMHETPKGYSNAIIPVEIKEGKAILPSLFLSKEGFEELATDSYTDHIKKVAGLNMKVDGEKLLSILDKAKNGEREYVNTVELAAIRIASESGNTNPDPNSIYYGEIEDIEPDVELPKFEATEESKFAETLGKPDGIAKFIHGNKVVEAGRSMLTRKFADMGYSVQIKVSDVEEDKIYYAVAVGTNAGFKVPVEVSNSMVIPPKVLFANEMVASFSKETVDAVIKSKDGGNRSALAAVSPCYDMKPSELLNVVKESVAEGNYLRAEEAINVLGEVDANAQKIAIANMISILSCDSKENMAEIQKIASQQVKDVPQFMSYKIFFPEGE